MNQNERFKILVKLALVDNQLDEEEELFIYQLARSIDFPEYVLDKMIKEEKEEEASDIKISVLSFEDKISVLIDLIKLMKADGKVLASEVDFCERVVNKLGFDKKSIGFLSAVVPMDATTPVDESKIHFRMRRYLMH